MWNLKKKKDTNELIYKTEVDSETLENKYMITKGEGMGRVHWGLGINTYILVYKTELHSISYNNL